MNPRLSPDVALATSARIAGVLLLAAAAAACHPARLGQGRDLKDKPVTVADRLDCPERQGELRRTDAAADGRTCRYSGPQGEEVVLSYLALGGRTPQAALEPVEAQFRILVPAAAAPEPGSAAATTTDATGASAVTSSARWSSSDDGKDGDEGDRKEDAASTDSGATPTPPRPPAPPQIDSSWKAGHGKSEEVHIRLPFLSIDADGEGRAKVKTIGAEVDASDDHAVVHAG